MGRVIPTTVGADYQSENYANPCLSLASSCPWAVGLSGTVEFAQSRTPAYLC